MTRGSSFPSGSGEDGQLSRMRIVVAVDFGTTFSSVAYANILEPRRQKLIVSWGDGGEMTQDKVPTVLRYDNDGTSGAYDWGFRAQEFVIQGKKIHEWFKLGLCNDFEERRARESELIRKYKSQTALPPVKGKECENLVVNYLSGIKGAVDRYFNSTFDETIARCPRNYIITVPALWDHAEQDKTRRCAERADMGKGSNLQIISEPEAACIYAVQESITAKVGDTYVICDAGGGTVDLASYTILSMEKGQTTHCKLAGAAPGSGGLCGSNFLNRIFEAYIEQKLRNYHHWKPAYMQDASKAFEEKIKPNFTGEKEGNENIRIQGLKASGRHGVGDNYLFLTTAELREHVFDEVILKIRNLVRDQIKNTKRDVTAVLLAGGFGQNPYLKKQLENIDIVVRKKTKVIVIENSDTAIARGALIAGLAGMGRTLKSEVEHDDTFDIDDIDRTEVVSRLAGRHYGTVANFPFEEGKDPEERRLQRDNGDKIQKMQWFAKRGDEIPESQPISFHFAKVAKVKAEVPAHEACAAVVHIYCCEKGSPPVYKDDSRVWEIAKLEIDLEGMDIPTRWIKGRKFYEAKFDVEMTLYSASLSFCAVYTHGREVKRFEAKNIRFL
ncbi:hypothetical protein DM02DRAFT_571322 [Periconia macrospinosa]|uniref:Actin-like ATPase domain-containing protein n=1 Tax=Periconia macrospinosa TaxID=97972 RepID=A0A2V1DB54_9PLEO|nr:hypothetical protein DM02DRAFT_571322 [Periconia macrospinosa]